MMSICFLPYDFLPGSREIGKPLTGKGCFYRLSVQTKELIDTREIICEWMTLIGSETNTLWAQLMSLAVVTSVTAESGQYPTGVVGC